MNFLRPIVIWGKKFMRIHDEGSFFFNFLGYGKRDDEELNRLGRRIHKAQQNLVEFIVNDARKTPLIDGLDKIFKFFDEISKEEDQKDFIYDFLDENRQIEKVKLITDAINDDVIETTKLIDAIYKSYVKCGARYIKSKQNLRTSDGYKRLSRLDASLT